MVTETSLENKARKSYKKFPILLNYFHKNYENLVLLFRIYIVCTCT